MEEGGLVAVWAVDWGRQGRGRHPLGAIPAGGHHIDGGMAILIGCCAGAYGGEEERLAIRTDGGLAFPSVGRIQVVEGFGIGPQIDAFVPGVVQQRVSGGEEVNVFWIARGRRLDGEVEGPVVHGNGGATVSGGPVEGVVERVAGIEGDRGAGPPGPREVLERPAHEIPFGLALSGAGKEQQRAIGGQGRKVFGISGRYLLQDAGRGGIAVRGVFDEELQFGQHGLHLFDPFAVAG